MKQSPFGWTFRIVVVLLVLACSMYAFAVGVDVSDRSGMPTAHWLTHLYYSLGLFVLGGMDLGTPEGGPVVARRVLWFAYFAAPTITTSAVIEGLMRVLGTRWLDRIGLRNHVVVVGIGQVGMGFVEALREREPRRSIVIVDRDLARANVVQARRRFGARFMAGDVRIRGTLSHLGLAHAEAIAFLTDDDLVNLEAAWATALEYPDLSVVAHVSDIAMQRAVHAVDGNDAPKVRVFNRHRLAARHLYNEHLRASFAGTDPLDTVVVVGFGRFGQTILEFLEAQAVQEVSEVIIVDRKAESLTRSFRDQVPTEHQCPVEVVEGDVLDPKTWESVRAKIANVEVPPVVVLGCDDDKVNLQGAMYLRRRWPAAKLFVRCQHESPFTLELAARHEFTVLAVDQVLHEALRFEQHAWLLRSDRK